MAYKMTKRGSLDNEVTNEFFCDTIEDRDNIPISLINLGTIALVLKPAIQIFIADSNKQWVSFISSSEATPSENDNAAPVVDQGQADNMTLQE